MAYDSTGRPAAEVQPTRDLIIRPFSDFGRVFTADDTATIQRAIDASSADGTFAVGQPGDFYVNGLVFKNQMKLRCPGPKITNLIARDASEEAQFISLAEDVVQNLEFSGCTLQGAVSGQHAMRLRAIPGMLTGFLQGGLWYFKFEDIEIKGFTGESIWLDGYGNAVDDPAAFRGPIQFGRMLNVRVFCASGEKRALRLSGQVGQIEFSQACEFDNGSSDITITSNSENILIQRAVNEDGTLNSDIAPYAIDFKGVTVQGNRRGVTIERSGSITFTGGHFENLYEGIMNDISGFGNIVDGVEFANVGYKGDGSGWGIKNQGGLIIARDLRWSASNETVATETHYIGAFNQEIRLEGRHVDITGIRTSGITPAAVASASSLNFAGFTHAFVNGPQATPINTITSNLVPGEVLTIRANVGYIVLGSGGNIDIAPYDGPLRIPQNAVVQLWRNDLTGTWKILGISGPRGHLWPAVVFVQHSDSPYQILPDTGTVRVSASAGDVILKMPDRTNAPVGCRISVKRVDSTVANVVYINGTSTAQNPDGQPDNTVRLTDVTQAFTFERNDATDSSSGWDTIASNNAKAGTPGSVALLTFGTHLTNGAASFDGSAPVTLTSDATSANTASAIIARDANKGFFAGPLTVDGANNRVGVGNTAPGFLLALKGASAALEFQNTSSSNKSWRFEASGNDLTLVESGVANQVIFKAGGNVGVGGSPGHPLTILRDGIDDLGTAFRGIASVLNAGSTKGIYIGYDTSEQLASVASQGASSGINFWTHNGSAWGERMRIHTNGNIGIGAAAPTFSIDIQRTTANINVQSTTGSNLAYIGFTNTAGVFYLGLEGSIGSQYGLSDNPYDAIISTNTTALRIGAGFSLGMTLTASAITLAKPTTVNAQLTVNGTAGNYGIVVTDSTSNTGINLQPHDSGSVAFIDNTRVGSTTSFRCSASTGGDTTWLSVISNGNATFVARVTAGKLIASADIASSIANAVFTDGSYNTFGGAVSQVFSTLISASSANASGTNIANKRQVQQTVASSGTTYGQYFECFPTHTSGTVAGMTGFHVHARALGSGGTTTTFLAFQVQWGVSTGATVGTLVALRILAPSVAGTISTTVRAVEIGNMGSSSTAFALITGTGIVQFGDVLITAASTSARAGFRMPPGTAPSSPAEGEWWYDGVHMSFKYSTGTFVFF